MKNKVIELRLNILEIQIKQITESIEIINIYFKKLSDELRKK